MLPQLYVNNVVQFTSLEYKVPFNIQINFEISGSNGSTELMLFFTFPSCTPMKTYNNEKYKIFTTKGRKDGQGS